MQIDPIKLFGAIKETKAAKPAMESAVVNPMAAEQGLETAKSQNEQVNLTGHVRQTQRQDRVQMEEKESKGASDVYKSAEDPNLLQPDQVFDIPLFAQLMVMEKEAQSRQVKRESDSLRQALEEDYRREELTPWEGTKQEYEQTALFTPDQSKALCRGFFTLSVKWLGEEETRVLLPQIFPEDRDKDRAQYLEALYDEAAPVNPEYAELVALNIVALLRKNNPGEDITATIDYVMQAGALTGKQKS